MKKDQRNVAEPGSDADYLIDPDFAERLFSRGLMELTDEQLSEIATKSLVHLSEAQIESLGNERKSRVYTWIDPLDAVHLLAPFCGSDANAKSAIAERLIDGGLSCSFLWSCDCIDFGRVPDSRPVVSERPFRPGTAFSVTPPKPIKARPMLGGAFRMFSDDWQRDQRRWDWVSGTLVGVRTGNALLETLPEAQTTSSKVLARMFVVHGAQFDAFDIENLAQSISQKKDLKSFDRFKLPRRGSRKPRNKKFNFAPILARLESEINNGQIKRLGKITDFGVQAMLEREIASHFSADDCPSESSIRRRAKDLMSKWRHVSGR